MKYVYSFREGNKDMRELLGGKGANLAEMTNLDLPVPSGFTVTTDACIEYLKGNTENNEILKSEILEHLIELENITKKKFGSSTNPLLVSVRSGARASMPGMLDTILNLGLNDEVCAGLIKKTGNDRFVYDSYRRLIEMYSDVVMNLPRKNFDNIFNKNKTAKGYTYDYEFTNNDLIEIIKLYKEEYKKLVGSDFPNNPKEQLMNAITAVFKSWNNERAKVYRKLNDIPDTWGTAVNIQEMVYGNMNDLSGTGVAFTRNPATGENKLFGEYLINAQGEDVVAGVRTPENIETLKEKLPECYSEFLTIAKKLENYYKDMQDMEFTIEDGKLYILQTRNGKRTAKAAVKIAVDLVHERLINEKEALLKVEPKLLEQLLHKDFDEIELKNNKTITKGLAASPGAAYGKVYFKAEDIKKAYDNGEKDLILVREETSPEDIVGMNLANGILTIRGGMTSHAAVVARGMGKCCVSGCSDISINDNKIITKDNGEINLGEYISLDGTTGNVYKGKIKVIEKEISNELEEFMSWADSYRRLKIRVNADTKKDALTASKYKAEGIGLCRSEHMFFAKERIFDFRRMILSNNTEERINTLNDLGKYQRCDYENLFEVMKEKPVVIRLLDPPLHEFLPKEDTEIEKLAQSLNISKEEINKRIEALKEFNPMMGHRGCRLAVTYPEIAKMQARAIIEAAINVTNKNIKIKPEIMIPLVIDVKELNYVKNIIIEEINKVLIENNINIDYKIGSMIETPRATIKADILAKNTEFFSFGTNDLTQLTLGFSRDDSEKFINKYLDAGIIEKDPFKTIDVNGVGKLVDLSCRLARGVNKNIELGICGEHGGDKESIKFFNKIGLDYVSCSPYRVLSARLAAAQAEIEKINV